jgi:hypothetical protein
MAGERTISLDEMTGIQALFAPSQRPAHATRTRPNDESLSIFRHGTQTADPPGGDLQEESGGCALIASA